MFTNRLDERIARLAYEYFIDLGLTPALAQSKVAELQTCIMRGWNTRAQILSAIKLAKASI